MSSLILRRTMGDTAEITQPKTEQVPLEDSFFYENPVTVLQSAKEMESSTIAIEYVLLI